MQHLVQFRNSAPVGLGGSAARVCARAIRASIWYLPRTESRLSNRCASPISSRFHRPRSCASSVTSCPAGPVRAARRESCSSIRASNPRLPHRLAADRTERAPAGSLPRTDRPDQASSRRRRIPLVEDQIDHPRQARKRGAPATGAGAALRKGYWHRESSAWPAPPLRQGCLRHQKRPCNLGRGKTAQRAQRQPDLRFQNQGRMAAGEHQREGGRQAFLRRSRCRHGGIHNSRYGDLGQLIATHPLLPDLVEEFAARRSRDPRAGIIGNARRGPCRGGHPKASCNASSAMSNEPENRIIAATIRPHCPRNTASISA